MRANRLFPRDCRGKRMKNKTVLLLVVVVLCVCAALLLRGQRAEEPVVIDFFAMDTYMNLRAYGPKAAGGLKAAKEEILRLEDLWSVTREDSEIFALNRDGVADVSADTIGILEQSKQVAERSGYAFDVTVLPLVSAWGFHGGEYRIPGGEELQKALRLVGSEGIEIEGGRVTLKTPGAGVDLGAVAKGCASHRAVQTLREAGVTSALVSLGGNVQALGAKPDGTPWRVAVQDPFDPNGYAGTLELTDRAAVTSGTYQRNFERDGKIYHHLLDPSTGYPADNSLASVTIVTGDGTLADALSTALLVMGMDEAVALWRSGVYSFDMVLVERNGVVSITEGLEGVFSSENGVSVIAY